MFRIFWTTVLIGSLTSCTNSEADLTVINELEILEGLVADVSQELATLGFSLNLKNIDLAVKDQAAMVQMFNRINQESRFEGKNHVDFNQANPKKSAFEDGAVTRLAFYDPNSRAIVFVRGATRLLTKGYLAHELAHVYQDQTWGFDQIWQPYHETPSRELFNITQFIIEGHAELVRQAYEQGYSKAKRARMLEANLGKISANDCLVCNQKQSTANLPYALGLRFMLKQYGLGGWPLVESFFTSLPSSTEQIIHPNKLKLDHPTEISLPAWDHAKDNIQLMMSDSLGEAFLLAELLKMNIDGESALASASGWDGDVAQVYRSSDGKIGRIWRLIFDRPIDAMQLEVEVSRRGHVNISRNGRVVDWIISDHDDITQRLDHFLDQHRLQLSTYSNDETSTVDEEIAMKNDADHGLARKTLSKVAVGPNL